MTTWYLLKLKLQLLAFNLKKTVEDQVVEKMIENLPKDNNKYCTEHTKGLNISTIKQDKKQQGKDDLFKTILNTDKKIAIKLILQN